MESLTSTDRGGMVNLIRSNSEACLTEKERAGLTCLDLSWGEGLESFSETVGRKTFGVVVASDVINPIYGNESWPALAKTIAFFSNQETLILLAYEQRESEGPIEDDPLLNEFWGNCKENGVEKSETLYANDEDCRYIFKLVRRNA